VAAAPHHLRLPCGTLWRGGGDWRAGGASGPAGELRRALFDPLFRQRRDQRSGAGGGPSAAAPGKTAPALAQDTQPEEAEMRKTGVAALMAGMMVFLSGCGKLPFLPDAREIEGMDLVR